MLELSQYSLVAGTILVALTVAAYVAVLVTQRAAPRATVTSPALAGTGNVTVVGTGGSPRPGLLAYSRHLVQLALLALTVCLLTRCIVTGRAPMSNQYEFAVCFGWGMVAAYVLFDLKYKVRWLGLAVLPIALAMLVYAGTLSPEPVPLMPALQNHLLLSLHVFTAVLAYGAAGVAFACGALFLLAPSVKWRGMPSQELLDEIGYRSVVVSFPLMTVMIILGAIWADIAWGRYWSWDPKETAALVTWLIYGTYLHARLVGDWKGRRAAWLLILGFAAILFTYFGNLFFGGLHAYA